MTTPPACINGFPECVLWPMAFVDDTVIAWMCARCGKIVDNRPNPVGNQARH